MIEAIVVGVLTAFVVKAIDDGGSSSAPSRQLPAYVDRPVGTSDTVQSIRTITGLHSGMRYRLSVFAIGATGEFCIARRLVGSDWISYVVDKTTGARSFWRADARNQAGMDRLRRDFLV